MTHSRYRRRIEHLVDQRTLFTLCGVNAIDWPLFCDRVVAKCGKCAAAAEKKEPESDS